MAFIRARTPRYFAPASFNTLDGDGKLITHLFDCEFRRFKLSELNKLQAQLTEWGTEIMRRLQERADVIAKSADSGEPLPQEAADSEPTLEDMVNRRLLAQVMTNWRAVQDEAGNELPFSLAALDATEEEFPGFINQCAKAFWKSTQPAEAAHLAAKN